MPWELNLIPFQLVKSIEINRPTDVSMDHEGNIFYATYKGDIIKYDPNLNEKVVFSPSNPNSTTILEARQGLRIFTFHRDLQQFRLINRNLSLNEDYSIPSDLVGFVEIATSSYDNNVWLIDQIDFSLKKYNILTQSITSKTPLTNILNSKNYEILYCKEYQNRLFISTKNHGILIFDNFGTYIKTYQNKNISYFNFWEDDIYFIDGNSLIRLNLYNDNLETLPLPSDAKWIYSLVYNNMTYLFSERAIYLYK